MLMLIKISDGYSSKQVYLNTSHVNVNLSSIIYYCISITYLNTSHVNVNQNIYKGGLMSYIFKYISC